MERDGNRIIVVGGTRRMAEIQVSAVDGSKSPPGEFGQGGEKSGLQEAVMQEELVNKEESLGESNNAATIPDSKEADSSAFEEQEAEKRIWRCTLCPETFGAKSIMKVHSNIHDGHRNYTCLRCPKQFKNAEACNIHYNAHYVPKNYSCMKCDKEFALKANLDKHQKMHIEIQNRPGKKGRWSCVHCPKSFCRKSDWIRHRRGLPCLERKRVTARLKESCRKLAELVNSLESSPDSSSETYSIARIMSEVETDIPDTTVEPESPPTENFSNDSDGSIEDNNYSGSDSEIESLITSTTKD